MDSVVRAWVSVQDRDSSFDRLFVDEYARVVAIAHRILGDVHEAEDVAQDVFCSFYRAHSPSATYASAWLHRAAAHTALNVIRGKRRRQRRETAEAAAQGPLAGTGSSTPDPQHELEVTESRREVRAALNRLPQKSAAALALRYSGLSYAEVAQALGTSTGQIGTLLRRAETALRKEMLHDAP